MDINRSLELIDKFFDETPADILTGIINSVNTSVKNDVSFDEYIDILMEQYTGAFAVAEGATSVDKCEPISVMTPYHVTIGALDNFYDNFEMPLAA